MNFQHLVVLLEEEEEENRSQRLAAIQIGDTVEGTVKSIHPFGAFVDIGGLQALCPKRFSIVCKEEFKRV